jgi:hypothetical protein
MRRSLKIAFLVCMLLVVTWLLIDTIQLRIDATGAVGNRAPNPIVGIWKDQHGTILDLRPDGTVRSRSIDDSTNEVHYYKYRLHSDQFYLYYSAKPDDYSRRIRQAAFGMTVDKLGISKLNDSELQLIEPSKGLKYVFERIEDSILETAR